MTGRAQPLVPDRSLPLKPVRIERRDNRVRRATLFAWGVDILDAQDPAPLARASLEVTGGGREKGSEMERPGRRRCKPASVCGCGRRYWRRYANGRFPSESAPLHAVRLAKQGSSIRGRNPVCCGCYRYRSSRSRNCRSASSRRSWASRESVATGRASSRFRPISSPVSSQ